MKKIALVIIAIILASTAVYSASTATFHKVNVTMVNQEPDPAEAGRYVTVRFKIENTGRENAEDIMFEFQPRYPFILDPSENAVQYVGSVHGKQVGDIGVIIDYRVKIDENAVDGPNEMDLRYSVEGGPWIKIENMFVDVQPHAVLLEIDSIDSPDMIEPGKKEELTINLENLATAFIKDIKVTLNLGGVPMAPIGSSNAKLIKHMDANAKKAVEFTIMAEPDAESMLYKVPVEIEFYDRLGSKYTTNETVGLIVGAKPDLSIIIDSSDIYTAGGKGEIPVKFTNKGVTDIKFLNVKLGTNQHYESLSPREVYVGNIDSDDYETADFTLNIKKSANEEVKLPLLVTYKDANNNNYEIEIDLPLKVFSAKEAGSMQERKGNGFVGILIVILIIGGGIFFYRRYKKKKK